MGIDSLYTVTILSGYGAANGINNQGEVVGFIDESVGSPKPAWWLPSAVPGEYQAPTLLEGQFGQLTGINDLGLVVPANALWNINWGAGTPGATPFANVPSAIMEKAAAVNNSGQIASGSQVYNWPTASATQLSTVFGPCDGLAINDRGDVAGSVSGTAFYSPTPTPAGNPIYTAGAGQLLGINNNRMAAGAMGAPDEAPATPFRPAFVQCAPDTAGLTMTPIPLPYPLKGGTSTAQAINNAGVIVGIASGSPSPEEGYYAFIATTDGSQANDLNTLLVNNRDWHLVQATGINDAGQIVGWAKNGNDWAGFVATPFALSVPSGPHRGGLAGIVVLLLETMGIALPPARMLSALPPEQRQTLLSFAIANLAGQLSDRETRSQIQNLANQAASRALALAKRPEPTQHQIEAIAGLLRRKGIQ